MRANHMQSHRFHIRSRLGIARGPRRGIALMWALIGITIICLLSVAAVHLARGERMVNDNFDSGRRALYLADQALSQFYADFRPTTNLSIPVISAVVDDAAEAAEEVEDGATEEVSGTYEGADLKVSNMSFENGDAIVTPYKIVESQFGDVYLLEASAAIYDARSDRPDANRTLRTYASLVPPFKLRAALMAPGGVNAPAPGKVAKDGSITGCQQCDHFHLDGGKKGKCGSGISVPALAEPAPGNNLPKSAKVHIKVGKDGVGVGIDSTTDTYKELMDSLHVDFPAMLQDGYYAGVTNFVDVPRDYPTVAAVFAANAYSRASLWPVVVVHGDVVINSSVKGFGLLVVEGSLSITGSKLDWRGVIMTGKGMTVSGTAHLHSHGAVAVGLNCSTSEAANGTCAVNFTGSHLGIAYAQCEAEAAWSQMLTLRPLTPSRHSRLF
jgi:hypothetical protein